MKNWRLNILTIIIISAAAIITCRLFYIQVVNHKLYQAQALGQQAGFREIRGARGEIFFQESKKSRGRNVSEGEVKEAAVNHIKYVIAASPQSIDDKNYFAETLGEKIGEPNESVFEKISGNNPYVVIKRNVVAGDVEKIKDIKLNGLILEKEPLRFYPQKNIASQIIGFVGGDGEGQYGLEGYYENILKSRSGFIEKGSGLNFIDDDDSLNSLNGSDLFLTIDYNIQLQAESLLEAARENIGIDSGQIIVMRPDSGKVLALANFPSFDINQYSKEKNLGVFKNSAVQELFEPGSVFKPFTMAMAIQEGKVKPEDTFEDTGFVTVGPDTIYNFNRRVYGKQSMSEILEKSINTGAVFLYQSVGRKTFSEYMEKFGFDEETGIDLQGEVYSKNENLKKGPDVGFVTASFGQGIEMTPIQLIRAFSVFANGGKIIKPYVVERIFYDESQQVSIPQVSKQILSEETVSEVNKMMINVVEKGFGSEAKVPGYYLAGKTGTAQVPREDAKGYYSDKTIQSFIGFGPALKPEFLILVKLDNPKIPQSSLSAAPIFRDLSRYIINYWQIPPDY